MWNRIEGNKNKIASCCSVQEAHRREEMEEDGPDSLFLVRNSDEEEREETCPKICETTKILSMNTIPGRESNLQHLEVLPVVENKEHDMTTAAMEAATLGNLNGIDVEEVAVNSLRQELVHSSQEGKRTERPLKKVSFALLPTTKVSSPEMHSNSREFDNIRRALKKTLQSIPKDETGKQDVERIAASYKQSYDQAAALLQRILAEIEQNPTLRDEKTALLLIDMMMKTIKMAAQSVPFEKIRPLRIAAWNYDRNIKIPFEITHERLCIADEEDEFVANTAEYALKDLQEAKDFIKLAPEHSPDEISEKFRQLFLTRGDRISCLLSHKTMITGLKYDDCFSKKNLQEVNDPEILSQAEQEYHIACDSARKHNKLLLELFNTSAVSNLNINQAKQEVINEVFGMALAKLKTADELIQMMEARKIK